MQARDDALDDVGRLAGLGGQGAHFVGHYGKATALLTGAGCFDGGIQGQQVGLLGNRVDHAGGLLDGSGFIGQ